MCLLTIVERHLRQVEVAPSRFGRDVAGDPRFVFDLRRGRANLVLPPRRRCGPSCSDNLWEKRRDALVRTADFPPNL